MVTFVIEHLEEEFYKWCQYGIKNLITDNLSVNKIFINQ